jgi:hypothetical protein
MGATNPEQVIRTYLTRPEASGGFEAIPTSFQFGKMRELGQRRLVVVTFATQTPWRMRFVCHLRQDDAGTWRFAGGAGGAVDGDPHRGQPWVNLGGGGWGDRPCAFYAGGQVLEHGGSVARVRLRSANGVLMEDTPGEYDLLLFLHDDPIELPLTVELLDSADQVITQHRWPLGGTRGQG